ncbi:MAG TPA: hypothetical protein VGO57_02710 [Verrucomicrobiae bacterium]|jgi:uncharacterized protein involved in exopolysaccharide biosynthesis
MAEDTGWNWEKPLATTPEAALLRQGLGFIFRNIFILIIGIAAGVILGFTVQSHLPSTYESTGSFVVDEAPFLQNKVQNNSLDGYTESALVQSLILGIPSLNLRDALAARLHVPADRICFADISARPLSLNGKDAVANIRITAVHNSRTGTISATSQSATFAAQVVNALLTELQNYNLALGRLNSLKLDMQFASDRALSIQNQAVLLEQTRSLQEQQVTQLDEYLKQGLPLESFPVFGTDITLNNLKTQRLLVEADYAAMLASTPGGLGLESKKAEVSGVQKGVKQQAQFLADGLRSQLAATRLQEQNLQAEARTAEQKVQQLSYEKADWVQSFGDIAVMKALIANHSKDLLTPGSAIVVVNHAVPAERAKSPILLLNLAIGVFVGGLAGLVVAILFALLDNRLVSAESVGVLTGLPCVATVPKPFWFGRQKKLSVRRLNPAGFDPLRSNLLLAPAGGKIQVMGFTPSGRCESCSRLVADLAVMLARAGRRTLVVDLHFSRPRQARLLHIQPKSDLADWMASTSSIEEYICPSELPELGLLTCVDRKKAAVDLAGRRPLATILPQLQDKWDIILIDAPAIRSRWDLALALPAEGKLVMTANCRRARPKQVIETARQAQSQGWNLLGVALQRCARFWIH